MIDQTNKNLVWGIEWHQNLPHWMNRYSTVHGERCKNRQKRQNNHVIHKISSKNSRSFRKLVWGIECYGNVDWGQLINNMAVIHWQKRRILPPLWSNAHLGIVLFLIGSHLNYCNIKLSNVCKSKKFIWIYCVKICENLRSRITLK